MVKYRACVIIVVLLTASVCAAQSLERALFVTNYASDNVTSFIVNEDESLDFVGTFATGDAPQTISLSPDGKYLAVGHGTISSTFEELRLFGVNDDASLSPIMTAFVPDSPLDAQWVSSDVVAVTETDFSESFVRMYRFDSQTLSFDEIDSQNSGAFNTQLTYSDSRQMLFANSSLGTPSIRNFKVDSEGLLKPIDIEPTEPLFALGMAVSNDGRHLYGAGGISGDDRRVLGFDVADDGQLSPLPSVSFASPGAAPKVLAITGDDTVLVAGHGGDGSVRSFLRDPLTGELSATGFSFSAGGQGDLGDLAIVGDVMFVTDEDSFEDGAGVYSVRIETDGSFTQIGDKADTMGSRPEYLAIWAPNRESLLCDFDGDSDCDIVDLNLLLAEGPIADGVVVGGNGEFDLDGNGVIDNGDRSEWLAVAASENGLSSPYRLGDANLDGVVDVSDFNLWNANRFTMTTNWDQGDFNGDGNTDVSDFGLWNSSKFSASDTPWTVPEPRALDLLICGLIFAGGRKPNPRRR